MSGSQHAHPVEHDDLDELLEQELQDPSFRGAYEDAEIRSQLLKAMVSYRKAAKLNQTSIAASMGTTQSAVSDLEGGGTDPRLSTLQRYARSVGCALRIEVVESQVLSKAIGASPARVGYHEMGSWTAPRFFFNVMPTQIVASSGYLGEFGMLASPKPTTTVVSTPRPSMDSFVSHDELALTA